MGGTDVALSPREIIRAVTDEMLGTGSPTAGEIADEALRRYPDVWILESERLGSLARVQLAKEGLRAREAMLQGMLPGWNFPAAIAVRNEAGDVRYVRTDRATWADVLAGKAEREHNVRAAEQKLAEYIEAMDFLRPLMAGAPDITVGDAVRTRIPA